MTNSDLTPTVFYTDLHAFETTLDALLPQLSPARREIVLRRPPSARMASAMGELLLCHALRIVGVPGYPTVLWQGKPRFADEAVPYAFNLSHAKDTVALLLTDRHVSCGIDCEEFRPLSNRTRITEKLFSAAERAWMDAQTDKTAAFFRIWTAKEAFIKYTGEGFSRPMGSILTTLTEHDSSARTADGTRSCRLYHISTSRGVICCAYADPRVPTVHWIAPEHLV